MKIKMLPSRYYFLVGSTCFHLDTEFSYLHTALSIQFCNELIGTGGAKTTKDDVILIPNPLPPPPNPSLKLLMV